MAQLPPSLRQKFFDSNGDPLAGGKVYTYAAGTSTPQATYTDAGGLTANANPTILDANGEANIWISALSYKIVLADSNDVILWTVDNVNYLPDGSVTTAKLVDGSVTTAKIEDGSVTQAKLATKTIVNRSLTIGSITSTTAVAITGTLAINTTGRPVKVSLIGQDSSGTPAFLRAFGPSNVASLATIELWRGATRISSQTFGFSPGNSGAALASYTTAGTQSWVAPFTGYVIVKGCGGGGAGGGSNSSSCGGGGGGAGGEFSEELAYVTAGQTYTLVIGAGGVGVNAATGNPGAATVFKLGSEEILSWRGGLPGVNGTDSVGPGGAGGLGYLNGGSGGAGGAGSGGTGVVGTAGSRGTGVLRTAAGGSVTASTPSAGNGGGGGGGGGSIGVGGNGPSNSGVGAAAPGTGGGGYGMRGVASQTNPGGTGGDGMIAIYDASAIPSGTQYTYMPASAFSVIDDTAPAGSLNYTVKIFVNASTTTLDASGVVSLQAYEL